jgi:hypothetical protein
MSDFDELYATQLAFEAVTVGALFVPWTYVVSGLINRFGTLPGSVKMPLGVFVAGAGFHLICEATGLNEYYLTNSAAHMRHMRKWRASCKSKPKNRKKPCGIYFME